MVWSGDREVIGSWKIMAMRPPRRARTCFSALEGRDVDRSPFRIVEGNGAACDPGFLRQDLEDGYAVTDLPDPDSPTSATVFPLGISNVRPSTARKFPASVLKSTVNWRTDESGASICSSKNYEHNALIPLDLKCDLVSRPKPSRATGNVFPNGEVGDKSFA